MFQFVRILFYVDPISIIMLSLILFIGTCIGCFAFRYMKGDLRYRIFFLYLTLLITSTGIMVTADHLGLLFGAWCISNLLLVRLMIHKSMWKAAQNAGFLAAKNYLFGALSIGVGLILLNVATGETSIKVLIYTHPQISLRIPALLFLLIGAMTQSAICPFHRWLISSLNSPTPVSAIMHAGLVNGGGFLILRFAPLYLDIPHILTLMFVIGIATALIGTLWKLLQNDVKRLLACSTMGQMGFMLAQCGLGLFPAAIAHLVTHGMFKAFLFLGSGSAAQQKRCDLNYPPKALPFTWALICGFLGTYCFSILTNKSWLAGDSTLVLMIIAFLTASQLALPILALKIPFRIPLALIGTSTMSLVYGANIFLISKIMKPMELMQPQGLNGFHIAAIIFLVFSWLSILFFKKAKKIGFLKPWVMKGYVAALNGSQPDPTSVTPYRNHYKYL